MVVEGAGGAGERRAGDGRVDAGHAEAPFWVGGGQAGEDAVERGDAGRQVVDGDGEGGTEAHATGAAAEQEHPLLVAHGGEHGVAQAGVGQREGAHQAAAADVGDLRVAGGQVAQQAEQHRLELGGPGDEALGLDDLEDAAGAHHVGERAAPGGVDARADGEDVVGHLVDAPAGHDAADLRLLAERDDVGLHAELLEGPGRAGEAAAGLHLVEDEQRVVLEAQRLHGLQELGPEVVVAALALDRLHEEAGDVVRVLLEGRPGGGERLALALHDVGGRDRYGDGMRGQANCGKRATFTGSVFVSDIV